MKRHFVLTAVVLMFVIWPYPILADCVNVSDFNNFFALNQDTFILYNDYVPLAEVQLQDCPISPASSIHLLTGVLCDDDEIIIDDSICRIIGVTLLN